jgi:hypothetical protein
MIHALLKQLATAQRRNALWIVTVELFTLMNSPGIELSAFLLLLVRIL